MTKTPWLKWYPADWRQEPTLRMCSRAARSLWMDMLGLMHDAEPYGHLLINGKRPSHKQLAAVLGDGLKDTERWLAELSEAGVYSVTDDGTIYCRKMVRDEQKRQEDKANGGLGGNPRLKPPDNGGVNPPDKAQKPETRSQSISDDPIFLVEFDLWYSSYPAKKGKPKALAAYKRARGKADAQTLLAGVARYKKMKPAWQEWAHPASWLNAERWLDEPDEPQKPTVLPFAIGG